MKEEEEIKEKNKLIKLDNNEIEILKIDEKKWIKILNKIIEHTLESMQIAYFL